MPIPRSRPLPGGVALACAAALLVATPSGAAVPVGGASYKVHHHATVGDGWHLELRVSSDSRTVRQLVMHSERCRETVLTSGLRIDPQGTIGSSKPFTPRMGARGAWTLEARFTDPRHLEGSFRITTPACDGGARLFSAHSDRHDHDGGHHRGHLLGTPPGTYPKLAAATPNRRRQARGLWRSTLRAARSRFPTYAAARALGYVPRKRPFRRPVVFHLRHDGYARDDHLLDARRPESLVYWWPAARKPVLIAFMYRHRAGRRPSFGRPLLGWHVHGTASKPPMTHVWLTGDLRSALATCMPVPALEAAIPAFRWATPGQGFSKESHPCPAS